MSKTIEPNGQETSYTYYPVSSADEQPDGLLKSEVHGRSISLDGMTGTGTGNSETIETIFFYDKAGLITKTKHDGQSSGTTEYHHTGQPTLVADATEIKNLSDYDVLGHRTSYTQKGAEPIDTDDLTSLFEYDERGRTTKSTDALGNETSFVYDRRGNVTEQTSADGTVLQYQYDAVGNRISAKDGLGRLTRFFYDNRNRLIQTLFPDGAVKQVLYNGSGQIAATFDALANETLFRYDARGLLVEMTYADATSTSNAYNEYGELIESVDGMGNVTQFVRDNLGRVTKTQVLDKGDNPAAPALTPISVVTVDYDSQGNVAQSAVYDVTQLQNEKATLLSDNPRSLLTGNNQASNLVQVTKNYYDAFNRPTENLFPDGTQAGIQYDAAGRVEFTHDELDRVIELQYDKYGRLDETISPDPDGDPNGPLSQSVTSIQYDSAGNQIAVTQTDFDRSISQTTRFKYDALNRVVTTVDAENGHSHIVYDQTGQLITAIDAMGRAAYTLNDLRGRAKLTLSADPDGNASGLATANRFRYDAVGNLIEQIDPLGTSRQYTYDALNRLVKETFVTSATVVDDGDTNFQIDLAGSSSTLPNLAAVGGDFTSITPASGDTQVRWKFPNLSPGSYRVLITWPDNVDAVINAFGGILLNGSQVDSATVRDIDMRSEPSDIFREDEQLGRPRGWKVLASEFEITGSPSSTHLMEIALNGNGYAGGIQVDAVQIERLAIRTFDYDDNGNLIEEIDTLGRTTNYTYDELNRLATTVLPMPGTQDANNVDLPRPKSTTKYDGYSNISKTIEERGGQNRETIWTYDQRNRVLTETLDAAGSETVTTKFEYNDVGNLDTTINDLGGINTVTSFDYDALNRLTTETITLNSGVQLVTESVYDALGNLAKSINSTISGALTHTTSTEFGYDRLGRQTHVIDDASGSLEAKTRFEYDAVGNLLRTTDPLGRISQSEYDRLNRLIKSIAPDPDGDSATLDRPETDFVYDVASNLIAQINAEDETEQFVYDNLNRLIASYDANNPNQEHGTLRTYDTENNLLTLTDPNDNTTTYTYDDLNRLAAETITLSGVGDVSRSYLYNAEGNLEEIVDRNDRKRTFEYDRLDRLRYENWLDGSEVEIAELEWQYDALGRVTQTRDTQGVDTASPDNYFEAFVYDDLGRVTTQRNYVVSTPTASDNPQTVQAHQYDLLASGDANDVVRTTATLSALAANKTFATAWATDRRGRVVEIEEATTGFAKQIDFTYDVANQLRHVQREVVGGLFETDYTYDAAGRLTNLAHQSPQSLGLTSYSYQYDQASRIIQQVTTHDTTLTPFGALSASNSENFTFDSAGQLTGDDVDTFAYDDNGNRTGAGITTGEHNRLSADANYSYTYDNEGNLTRRDSNTTNAATTYAWDYRNRLVEVQQLDGTTLVEQVNYRYNADDQLVERTTGADTEHYVYNGSERVLTLADNGDLKHRTIWGPASTTCSSTKSLVRATSYKALFGPPTIIWAA